MDRFDYNHTIQNETHTRHFGSEVRASRHTTNFEVLGPQAKIGNFGKLEQGKASGKTRQDKTN